MDDQNSKVEIIPAIMPDSYSEIEEKVNYVAKYVNAVQLDIMDGKFVPEKTWPHKNNNNELEKIIIEDAGLPEWDRVNYEIDLMVNDPEKDAVQWIKAGASRIIFHIKSAPNINEIIQRIKNEFGDYKNTVTAPEIGVAIDNGTDLRELEKYLILADFVQFMGIDKIGYQGEPFSQKIIPRITEFRKNHIDTIISVDGAVNDQTAKLLIGAGVNRLVSGSFIFSSEHVKDALESLRG